MSLTADLQRYFCSQPEPWKMPAAHRTKKGARRTRIKIARLAMNPSSATAFGLVFKLSYAFANPNAPELVVFADDDLSRAGEWHVYGVSADACSTSHDHLKFSSLADKKETRMGGVSCCVTFVRHSKIRVSYPRGGETLEPIYEFDVEMT